MITLLILCVLTSLLSGYLAGRVHERRRWTRSLKWCRYCRDWARPGGRP